MKIEEVNSKKLIGNVEERYDQLKRKKYDWVSFYSGWLEGRAQLLKELKEN
jgi:predicted metal-dependent HD superfamily phosphohydrolase